LLYVMIAMFLLLAVTYRKHLRRCRQRRGVRAANDLVEWLILWVRLVGGLHLWTMIDE